MTNLIETMARHFETLGQYHDLENPQYRRGIARAALAAIEAAGYRVVPVEMTEEMGREGGTALINWSNSDESSWAKGAGDIYAAIVAAAPKVTE